MPSPARGHIPFPCHRTCAEMVAPPEGCTEVPAEEMREAVAGTLGGEPDDNSPEFRTGMMLVCPMFVPAPPEKIPEQMCRWTGYDIEECRRVATVMTANGIWKDGQPDLERYLQGEDKPGLQIGDMALVLDILLCLGKVRYMGDDLWCAADTWKKRVPPRAGRIEQFAEHLADGLSVKDAARLVGATSAYGNAMLQRIRRRLGAQAI